MSIDKVLKSVASKLGVDALHLTKLINFESRFNPKAVNKYSGASGILQFTDTTARILGYKNAADLVKKNPTVEKQLKGPVLKYLENYKPFTTPQSLYMAVFYPKYRYSPLDTLFPDNVRKLNPGINKVSDYVNKVEGKTAGVMVIKKASAAAFLIPVFFLAVTATYNHFKKEGGFPWQRKSEKQI